MENDNTKQENSVEDNGSHPNDREIPALKKPLNRTAGFVFIILGAGLAYFAINNAIKENEPDPVKTIEQEQQGDYKEKSVPRINLADPKFPEPEIIVKSESLPPPPEESEQKSNKDTKNEEKRLRDIADRKRKGNMLISFSSAATLTPSMLTEDQTLSASIRRIEDPSYTLVEGKVLGAILETAIQSDVIGKLRAVCTEPVYSYDGMNLLIPQGSRFIGEYKSGLKAGKARIFAIWTRAITPDGISIVLDSPAIGDLGRAGMGGWVDTHFWERFGTAALFSIIGAGIDEMGADVSNDVADDFRDTAETDLEQIANIPPTLHRHHGQSFRIFLAKDINFRKVLNKEI